MIDDLERGAAALRPSPSGGRRLEAKANRRGLPQRVARMEHSDRTVAVDDQEVTDAVLPRQMGGCSDR
jgi:hypothetical protein